MKHLHTSTVIHILLQQRNAKAIPNPSKWLLCSPPPTSPPSFTPVVAPRTPPFHRTDPKLAAAFHPAAACPPPRRRLPSTTPLPALPPHRRRLSTPPPPPFHPTAPKLAAACPPPVAACPSTPPATDRGRLGEEQLGDGPRNPSRQQRNFSRHGCVAPDGDSFVRLLSPPYPNCVACWRRLPSLQCLAKTHFCVCLSLLEIA
jgi:hypothetical protein